jgi:23S rRNA (uridine2552-2'-O)-methyltransferase
MARTKSSRRWLNEHFKDEFVKKAWQEGFRSRAVYKLIEIQEKDHILRRGMIVVDLGAAPGGWSEYAAKVVGPSGHVFALDILPMDPVSGVDFILGDFREQEVVDQLLATMAERRADLVMSDMAPNISGMSAVDQPRAIYLAELAFEMAKQTLVPGGDFLVKLFQGEGFDSFVRTLRDHFGKIVFRKPKASRGRSREVYALARGYNL